MGGKNYKALILFLLAFAACRKDKPASVNSIPKQDTGNVYVICEGNFGNGDASLYLYRPGQDTVFGDLYAHANGQPLGDVFQSMVQVDGKFFLCINNSDKVVVIDKDNWLKTATISIPKPRYILPVSSTKAYVSSLYSNKLSIINPTTLQISGTVPLPFRNAEGMLLYNGYAYICMWDTAGNSICKVNTATDEVEQTIRVGGYAPQAILPDKEQMLWVLSGNQPQGKNAFLTRIDPSTGEILRKWQFDPKADPLRPVFNNTRDTLYFIEANYYGGTDNDGIYRMSIHDTLLPAQPFIPAQQYQYFWALGIDPVTGQIYVGDPKGFVQKGVVNVYLSNGVLVRQFKVGAGPGHFYFD